jgi:hypothetical protein
METLTPINDLGVDMKGKVIAALGTLTKRELDWLSRWAWDGESQEEIAEHVGYTQGRVSQIIASALTKLAAAGVPVERLNPTNPAHEDCAKAVLVSPDALDRLLMNEDGGGVKRGRWIDTEG